MPTPVVAPRWLIAGLPHVARLVTFITWVPHYAHVCTPVVVIYVPDLPFPCGLFPVGWLLICTRLLDLTLHG